MSKFNKPTNFFKNKPCSNQITIKTKVSQKEIKEQKKNKFITEEEFDNIMKDTSRDIEIVRNSKINSDYCIKFMDIIDRIKEQTTYSIKLFSNILNKLDMSDTTNWFKCEETNELVGLIRDNLKGQLNCLYLAQNFVKTNGYNKIQYKNNKVYKLRLIFLLMFTCEIIEESVFWEWLDSLENFSDIIKEEKNLLIVQTTEFFMILKTEFTDNDYKDENKINEDNTRYIKQNKSNSNSNSDSDSDSDSDSKPKIINSEYIVPEEQDYFDDI